MEPNFCSEFDKLKVGKQHRYVSGKERNIISIYSHYFGEINFQLFKNSNCVCNSTEEF